MKNSTKGAFAAATAAVLLMGGAGSLAYWTAAKPLTGGTISTGELSLTQPECAGWVYAAGKAGAGTAVGKIVPGDVVSKTCTFTVKAAGDNLKGTLVTPTATTIKSSAPSAPSMQATVSAGYTIDGAAIPATITSAQNNKTVTAVLTATFPYGSDESASAKVNANDTQNVVATLNDISVTLTQANPN